MKYEHTVVMTVELTKIFDENHSEDLSRAVQKNMTEWFDLTAMFDDVIFTNCQDFIREENEAVDPGDWIRFDPYDRLTWPPTDNHENYDDVLVCSEDGYLYFGTIYYTGESQSKPKWWLSNTAEDIQVPLDSVIAWQPLPVPYGKEVEAI